MGCNSGAIGIIRLPRNAAAHIYPGSDGRNSAANCDFFISARDESSRTEWQIALQLELQGSSCLDALSAHNQNRRALHSQQELEEAIRAKDTLVRELAASEKELLDLKMKLAASNQREADVACSNASLLQRVAKLEAEVRFIENEKFELKGRMTQVAATADSEHSRLAASECALREQNTEQLKRIAILEDRVEALQRLSAVHAETLEKLSISEKLLQQMNEEKKDALRNLHARVEKCKSLERQLSTAKADMAADEQEMMAARATAARALDDAAACRLKCNELDGVSWSQREKLLKAQEALAPLRKRVDVAEQKVKQKLLLSLVLCNSRDFYFLKLEKYERQLEEAKHAENLMRSQVSQLEKENRDLKMEVQGLAAEKQAMRLELLQANLEKDKVRGLAALNVCRNCFNCSCACRTIRCAAQSSRSRKIRLS